MVLLVVSSRVIDQRVNSLLTSDLGQTLGLIGPESGPEAEAEALRR